MVSLPLFYALTAGSLLSLAIACMLLARRLSAVQREATRTRERLELVIDAAEKAEAVARGAAKDSGAVRSRIDRIADDHQLIRSESSLDRKAIVEALEALR